MTAILFKIGEYALGFYLNVAIPLSAFGAAGSVILLLLWVYYSAQILFLGAEFTQYSTEFGSGIQPERDAVPLAEEVAVNGASVPKRTWNPRNRRAVDTGLIVPVSTSKYPRVSMTLGLFYLWCVVSRWPWGRISATACIAASPIEKIGKQKGGK